MVKEIGEERLRNIRLAYPVFICYISRLSGHSHYLFGNFNQTVNFKRKDPTAISWWFYGFRSWICYLGDNLTVLTAFNNYLLLVVNHEGFACRRKSEDCKTEWRTSNGKEQIGHGSEQMGRSKQRNYCIGEKDVYDHDGHVWFHKVCHLNGQLIFPIFFLNIFAASDFSNK